ncbi:hypothetical protein CCHR01_18655 [Colletotrichum chrysophilum]|uniref:Protein kinase domain-containing protein n=1 Tax=Colletotrichum chrysophilum TaxID=1836956 RepID=A0AAD9EB92_9PEZI|nr:hypothetical protein CCHR01_18655 [Colletotrichum chrysophilum]
MSGKFKSSIELEVARYYPTQRLNLYSYKPVDPYGVKGYIPNPLPADLPPGCVRGFDPTNLPPTPDVVLEIVRPLSAGKKKRAQITVCKTLQHLRSHDSSVHGPRKGGIWPELMVCKSFDAVFFPPFPGCSADKMAEKALSRENGAYRHLYAKNFTGFPHITPEFYGSYVAEFDLGRDGKKQRVYRCASVILMEYVDGLSVESLCRRHPETGDLIPRNTTQDFHQNTNGQRISLSLHKETRQEIVRQLIEEGIHWLHQGMEFGDVDPDQALITMRHGQYDLVQPRLVILDYTHTHVWCMTKTGKTNPRHPITEFQKLPSPTHPSELFDTDWFTHWIGWWPSSFCHKAQSEDEEMELEYARDSNGDLVKDENDRFLCRNEVEFEVWMLKVWGPREEGRYSVGETLNRIRDDEQKKTKEKVVAAETEAAAETDALMLALGLRNPKSDIDADDKDRSRSQ